MLVGLFCRTGVLESGETSFALTPNTETISIRTKFTHDCNKIKILSFISQLKSNLSKTFKEFSLTTSAWNTFVAIAEVLESQGTGSAPLSLYIRVCVWNIATEIIHNTINLDIFEKKKKYQGSRLAISSIQMLTCSLKECWRMQDSSNICLFSPYFALLSTGLLCVATVLMFQY